MRSFRKSAWRRLLAVSTLVVALLAALVMPIGAAGAAVSGSNIKPAAGSSTPAGGSAAAKSKQAAPTKPTAPPKMKAPAAISPDAVRKARAAAAAHAIATSTVPNTCSGAIQPDTIYPCAGSAGPDTFTATLTSTTDVLLVEAMSTNGSAGVSITAPDGTTLSCRPVYGPMQCPTTGAGTYTFQVSNSGSDFTLDYRPLLSDTSCATADTSFAAPTIQGNLADGSVGDCYLLNLPSGSVVDYAVTGQLVAFFDTTGQQACGNFGNCTLTGTGPYRVNVSGYYSATASPYQLWLNSLTNPRGCLTAAQQIYGQVPDASSTVRCRSLTVAAAGQYQIYGTWGGAGSTSSTLYNLDGSVACTNSGADCNLAAGTYSFVAYEDISGTPLQFGVVFIAANESGGCTSTGDTDFAAGPVSGTFAGLGEEICLTLPTASGLSDYVLNQKTTDGTFPAMQVLDSTGAQQCSDPYFTYHVCDLSGTAPFHLVLSNRPAGEGYKELVQRTDSIAGCAAWPQSGFGGSWGVQVSLDPSVWGRCLSIPANAHSTGEMIDYANTGNKVNASLSINDPTGKQICYGSPGFCSYQAGVAYTALLMSSTSVTDTYNLVRRDVSGTASCAAPASTTVGGPSTPLMLNSDLDAACFRVTAATTDMFWTDVRAVAPNKAGAILVVTDPTGKIVCRQWGTFCNVTGSAGYQAVVVASGYEGVTIPAHVDIWRVGTAAGWASQCTAHRASATGFPVQSGTLSETSTAYCAVVPMQAHNVLGVYGSDTGTGVNTVKVDMFMASDWTSGTGLCVQNQFNVFGFECSNSQLSNPVGDAVLLVTPGAVPPPAGYTMQGVMCMYACPAGQATVSAVSPAQGVAGVDRLTVTGTGLTLGTHVQLAKNGFEVTSYLSSGPVSVSPDGTSLTVDLDTYGLTPGTYDMVLNSPGYTVGTPSPGYLPNAFTVTAAPPPPAAGLLMPLTPTRVLDTRHGVGAPQARVAAGGVVKLQVSGVAGIPATGVTAVVMNTTVTGPASGGYVTVYPDGATRPTASSLNFSAGETIPNLVVVPVVDGKVDFYNGSGGALDLIADVTGYYTSSGSGSALNTVGPARVLDTRHGVGAPQAKVGAGGVVKLQIDGVAGIPATGVTAVVMNVTVTGPASGGYVTVYPDGVTRPTASNLNFTAGETIPNLVVVPVVDGKVDFYNGSGGALDLIADVTGYYASSGAAYHPAGPTRAMDTRSGLGGAGGVVAPGAAAVLPIMGSLGFSPGNVTAVVLNVTVTGPTAGGYLTVYSDGTPRPTASSLNFSAGETIPNLVVVPVVDGNIDFYNGSSGTVHVIADVEGYFAS